MIPSDTESIRHDAECHFCDQPAVGDTGWCHFDLTLSHISRKDRREWTTRQHARANEIMASRPIAQLPESQLPSRHLWESLFDSGGERSLMRDRRHTREIDEHCAEPGCLHLVVHPRNVFSDGTSVDTGKCWTHQTPPVLFGIENDDIEGAAA